MATVYSSTFQGLDTALSGLEAFQGAEDITGENVANADTPGYTRQVVDMDAVSSSTMDRGDAQQSPGAGVSITGYSRMRDSVTDTLARQEMSSSGYANAEAQYQSQIQSAFPSDTSTNTGLQNTTSTFWASWQTLAGDPTSSAARQAVVSDGQVLASQISAVAAQVTQVQSDAGGQFSTDLGQVNQIASSIASLTQQITAGEAGGENVNSLLDQRDSAVDSLANLGDTQTTAGTNGALTVTFGGLALVTNSTAATATASNITLTTGEMAALQKVQNVDTVAALSNLNTLASGIATAVNNQSTSGFDANGDAGTAFFTGTTAATLAVAAPIVANPQLVAASNSATDPGSGDNAAAVADIETKSGVVAGVSPDSFYEQMVNQIGTNSQEANQQQTIQQAGLTAATSSRDQVSGVSINEEMTNLLAYQQSYTAAARVFTAMDQMLQTLISSTGTAGL